MLLLFGTRAKTVVVALVTLVCGRHGGPAAHELAKRQTRFTLFFVPLFPVGRARWSTQCTQCGWTTGVSGDEAAQLQSARAA